MPIPTARIRVQFLRITNLPRVDYHDRRIRYARGFARIARGPWLTTGRSRPIPSGEDSFYVGAESSPWVFEFNVESGTAIDLMAEVREDRGDSEARHHLVRWTVNDPWEPGLQSPAGEGVGMIVQVERILVNPDDQAFVARAHLDSGVSGTLRVPQGLFVEIVEIRGLYKPRRSVRPGVTGSSYERGYVSEDNLGRVFTNRESNGDWHSDTQYIDVHVRVRGLGGCPVPADAIIQWTVDDVDDPTNDRPEFHREWGPYVDRNDYGPSGNPRGAQPGDNAGAFSSGNTDEDLLFSEAVRSPETDRWSRAPSGPQITTRLSRRQAETAVIVGSDSEGVTSAVRIHCPNVLGTTFVVRAELVPAPSGIPVHNASTGVITMWSRIDVEVKNMPGAHSLRGVLTDVPRYFHPACIQLDFHEEEIARDDKPKMCTEPTLLRDATRAWIDNVFTNKYLPGWFFLGAAKLPYDISNVPADRVVRPIYTSRTYTLGPLLPIIGTEIWVEVPEVVREPASVKFIWTEGTVRHTATFQVLDEQVTSGGSTRMRILGDDVTPGFTGHDADGSKAHAYSSQISYYPRHQSIGGILGEILESGGFAVPDPPNGGAEIEIYPRIASFDAGISPLVPSVAGGSGEFFAGRTVIFTHTPNVSTGGDNPSPLPNFDNIVVICVVHEFVHAHGLPHKCGNWNWRIPRARAAGHSCCMNYPNTRLLDASHRLTPGTAGFQGPDMCGRHLMELRRVHLERNLGLGW